MEAPPHVTEPVLPDLAIAAPAMRCFRYGSEAIDHLVARDARLAHVMEAVGHVYREVDPDLFSSVVHHIVGQQISTKAQATVWRRMGDAYGAVDAARIVAAPIDELQAFGMTFRKAAYIRDFATRVHGGSFDLEAIRRLDDAGAIARLVTLKGIGTWTAEMILLFCFERPDVLSSDDLAIQRGLRMVYRHRAITAKLFERYRRRFSPHGSVASLYLWAVAGGAVSGLRDAAPRGKTGTRASRATGRSAMRSR